MKRVMSYPEFKSGESVCAHCGETLTSEYLTVRKYTNPWFLWFRRRSRQYILRWALPFKCFVCWKGLCGRRRSWMKIFTNEFEDRLVSFIGTAPVVVSIALLFFGIAGGIELGLIWGWGQMIRDISIQDKIKQAFDSDQKRKAPGLVEETSLYQLENSISGKIKHYKYERGYW